ncbi:hypothetical protein TNCV_2692451 [Trichonephila clavipes]|uniref:Uncharacterized protein n=1 Tax=Trichonephila clavipes TaxID=2585209 RepID=A0A8X7BBU3_TRICX|nr:hypothetical protein TNCV_2692451 [Trichonephila clavipes]
MLKQIRARDHIYTVFPPDRVVNKDQSGLGSTWPPRIELASTLLRIETRSVAKSPRVAEQCDVNIQSINLRIGYLMASGFKPMPRLKQRSHEFMTMTTRGRKDLFDAEEENGFISGESKLYHITESERFQF